MLFAAIWLIGAVISWIGAAIYGKHLHGFSWEEFFRFVKQARGPLMMEVGKCLLYIVAWPIEIGALIYQRVYMKYMERRIIKSFSILDKEES